MTPATGNGESSGRGSGTSSERPRAVPSISYLLLILAVIAAGSGALAWTLVRPEPRTVEIFLPTPGPVTVHVNGAVENPGLYTLPPDSRVADAIEAAGGLTGDSSINLAAQLRDGQQIVVFEGVSASASQGTPGADILLDLNTASASQLEELPDIGPARAAAIIEFREQNGPIIFVDDLTAIDGIGLAIVDSIRPLVIQP